MGVSSSRIEEDKALQLCRERKKFVRQALDGRCSLATAHVTYVQLLKSTGTALRKFIEPEVPVESSLYTSASATSEPLALTEKSPSQFSFSSPPLSRPVDANEPIASSPPPPGRFQAHLMKFRSSFSKKVEEKPPLPVTGTITSSSIPQNTISCSTERPDTPPVEASPLSPGAPPWDYFNFFNPIDSRFSAQEGRGLENVEYMKKLEEEGIPDLEDEEDKVSNGKEKSLDSEDEFDVPCTDTLVRRFDNLTRVSDHTAANATSTSFPGSKIPSEAVVMNGEGSNSSDMPALRGTSSAGESPVQVKATPLKEESTDNKVSPKDFLSSMKDIENLFIKASDSGRQVPRMLEANKLHFRPILSTKEGGSVTSVFFKACFSCGEDPSHVPDDPVQSDIKYLTWHRTISSRSSSSRNLLSSDTKEDDGGIVTNIFDSHCMISGSHASTLDRLHAWERKLYDEVKASEMVRREYDMKCKVLRQQESKGEASNKIDKTRAAVKDLHSRIRVAIQRIDSISKRIEELRDNELQPQLEELIEGLSRMWEVMHECHKLQFQTITKAYGGSSIKFSLQSESHRHAAFQLESDLSSLSTSFTKWIAAQKSYVQAIDGWLLKCVFLQEKSSRRKRRARGPPDLRNCGPPIYTLCGEWMKMLDSLRAKEVGDCAKGLAAEAARFLPQMEKACQGRAGGDADPACSLLRDEDRRSGFDSFRASLVGFLGQLNEFAESSVLMYRELKKAIEEAKKSYAHFKSSS